MGVWAPVRSGTSAWPKISQNLLGHAELFLDHAELGAQAMQLKQRHRICKWMRCPTSYKGVDLT
jgi:hypothetical protein